MWFCLTLAMGKNSKDIVGGDHNHIMSLGLDVFELPKQETDVSFAFSCRWWQTNNILAPIITHGIYSTVILGHGLMKIRHHRRRLRQRLQHLQLEEKKEV